MSNFYVWISILVNEYEPIISNDLLDMGYIISPIDTKINKDQLLAYKLYHKNKTTSEVKADMTLIMDNRKLKCHSCIVMMPCLKGIDCQWSGTNISFTKEDKEQIPASTPPTSPHKDSNPAVEDVVDHVNRLLNEGNARIRENRNQC